MPVAVEALRKLLTDFNARTGAKMSAIVSRSGVPVAWVLPDDAQVDNFAMMAATLPESTIETGRQVARPLGRDSCGSDLS